LNVAILVSELPYPATAGSPIRTLNLALRLARRHAIRMIAHRGEHSDEAVRFLSDHGIAATLVDRAPRAKSGPGFYFQLLANLASPLPYSVVAHSSPALRAAVRSLASSERIDLWQSEATIFVDAMADLKSATKTVIAHNVESLIWERYAEAETRPLKRWYIRRQWRKFERFERRAFASASRVVAVSEPDATIIRNRFGVPAVDVIDNGIDRHYFETVQFEPEPATILFLGSLDWRPNIDAIGVLLDTIYPAVRAAEPTARLQIVGRAPAPALIRRIHETPGVELHADVPDIRPFLARSSVLVVPLRIGGGSRLKILEAAAAGVPVISTRVGAEGLELVPGEHYTAADEPRWIADALVAGIRDPRPSRTMAERTRAFVLDRYDWDGLADRLEQVWFDCLERRSRAFVEAGSAPV
jgi:glycosyltransferase involved in cell wall biosynthesis